LCNFFAPQTEAVDPGPKFQAPARLHHLKVLGFGSSCSRHPKLLVLRLHSPGMNCSFQLVFFYQDCPNLSSWTVYTQCSVSCGGGTRRRTRVCQPAGANCSGLGPLEETTTCNGHVSWFIAIGCGLLRFAWQSLRDGLQKYKLFFQSELCILVPHR